MELIWHTEKDDRWHFPCCVVLQVLYLQQAEVTRERVYAMHQSSIDGVEDMSALAELHDAAIMHNLYQRYQKDNIYVSALSWTHMSHVWDTPCTHKATPGHGKTGYCADIDIIIIIGQHFKCLVCFLI